MTQVQDIEQESGKPKPTYLFLPAELKLKAQIYALEKNSNLTALVIECLTEKLSSQEKFNAVTN